MLSAEVSVYPLKTEKASAIINECIDTIDRGRLKYDVGSISTFLQGEAEEVWTGIIRMFEHAAGNGEVSMVLTITNAAR